MKGQRRFWLGRPSGLFIGLATSSWYQCPKYEWDMLRWNRHLWSRWCLAQHLDITIVENSLTTQEEIHSVSSATWDVSCQRCLICLLKSIITLTYEERYFQLMVRMIGIRETFKCLYSYLCVTCKFIQIKFICVALFTRKHVMEVFTYTHRTAPQPT